MSDTATSEIIECPACQVPLYTAGITDGEWIRCSRCHAAGMLGGPLITQGSPLAMASLVLGLLAIFTTFITGVPAIVLGVLALRKLRVFARHRTGRALAIAGICCGALFSLFGGVCLLSVTVGLVYFRPSRDPATVQRVLASMGQPQLPGGVEAYEASAMPMGVSVVHAGLPRDVEDADRGVRIFLMRYPQSPTGLNDAQLEAHAFSQRWALHKIRIENKQRVTMLLGDQPHPVRRIRGSLDGIRYEQYLIAINTQQGPLVLLLSTPVQADPAIPATRLVLNEADVRRFLSSIQFQP